MTGTRKRRDLLPPPDFDGTPALHPGGLAFTAVNEDGTESKVITLEKLPGATIGMAVARGLAVAVFGGTASYALLWSPPADILWIFATYAAFSASLASPSTGAPDDAARPSSATK